MNIPLAVLLPAVAIVVTVGLYLLTRTITIEHRLSTIETQLSIWLKFVEKGVMEVLHHPERAELDRLLERRRDPEANIQAAELQDYMDKLQRLIADPDVPPGERTAATLALAAAMVQANMPKRKPFWRWFW